MYEQVMETMEIHGLKQYEISNFAKPGFESRHNLTYWDNLEYYGIGAGAHGYTEGKRIANYGPLKKYMNSLMKRSTSCIRGANCPEKRTNGRRNVFRFTKNGRCIIYTI